MSPVKLYVPFWNRWLSWLKRARSNEPPIEKLCRPLTHRTVSYQSNVVRAKTESANAPKLKKPETPNDSMALFGV